jgi:hypothetical protein
MVRVLKLPLGFAAMRAPRQKMEIRRVLPGGARCPLDVPVEDIHLAAIDARARVSRPPTCRRGDQLKLCCVPFFAEPFCSLIKPECPQRLSCPDEPSTGDVLSPVPGIGLVAVPGNQRVAVWVAHDHLVHTRREIPIQPIRQRAFLNYELPGPGNCLDKLHQLRNRRRLMTDRLLPARIVDVPAFANCAMHVQRDEIRSSHNVSPGRMGHPCPRNCVSDLRPRTS